MLDPATLYPRRLAWRALGMVLERYALEAMALKLNPDDPTQALPGAGPGEIEFFEDYDAGRGQVLATVILEETRARVLVDRIERLLRRAHAKGFDPREVGIGRREGLPDVDVEVELGEVIEAEGERMRTKPQRVVPAPARRRRPGQAIRAFGSSR